MNPREMLKPREMIKEESKCTEEHAPKCQATCPLHLDMRKIIARVKIKDFTGALEIFQKGALFPRIIAKGCDAPCQNHCRRGDIEGLELSNLV